MSTKEQGSFNAGLLSIERAGSKMYTSTLPYSGQLSASYDLEETHIEYEKFDPSLEPHKLETKSQLQLLLISIGLVGSQIAFSVQFAEGTRFLLSLGVSSTLLSQIWLVPPICGVILQPLFGAWSDTFHCRWGRRKPFIAVGGAGLAMSLLGMSWVADIGQVIDRSCSAANPACTTSKLLGIATIIFLNISANSVIVGVRSMMVDQCCSDQQPAANAWATRLINSANIYTCLISYVDLPSMLPVLGDSQLNALTLLGSFIIIASLCMTCLGTIDKPFQIWKVQRNMPRAIIRIQIVQSFSWFAWFPFMLYISSYINDRHLASLRMGNPHTQSSTRATIHSLLHRQGSLGLLAQAIFSLITILFLPEIMIRFSGEEHAVLEKKDSVVRRKIHRWLTYRNIWLASQLLCSLAIFGILSTDSEALITILMGTTGFSGAVMNWIPFTLISLEIIRERELQQELENESHDSSTGAIIGINNVSIAVPQVLAMLCGTFVFTLVSEEQSGAPIVGIMWIIGGSCIAMLVAAACTLRLNTPVA